MSDEKPKNIDRIRNAAITGKIGSAQDQSAIKEFIEIDGKMYVVKDNGIYSYKLADEIDPARSTLEVPNVQQRVAQYGAADEIVCRTLLTGKRLFKKIYLGPNFDEVRALSLTFDLMRELLAAKEMAAAFRKTEDTGKETITNWKDDGYGFSLPSSSNLKADTKAFIQRMDHAFVGLFKIIKLFFPDTPQGKWFDSFCNYVVEKFGKDEEFVEFLDDSLWFLNFIRNMRTGIEHKDADQAIKIRDFEMGPKDIHLPSIEVVHPDTPHSRVSIADLSAHMVDRFSTIAEMLFAFLCGKSVTTIAGMPLGVFVLPEDQRGQEKLVRFSYGTTDGTRIVRVG